MINRIFSPYTAIICLFLLFGACAQDAPTKENNTQPDPSTPLVGEAPIVMDRNPGNVVNVYSYRHYDQDKALYRQFEQQLGIKVNVLQADARDLINRIQEEGQETPADILITGDAGQLFLAREIGIVKPLVSATLRENVPDPFRDYNNHWCALSKMARVIVYAKDRVEPSELSTYAALTAEKWKGRLLVGTADDIYNQSLVASMIMHDGKEKTTAWTAGIIANLARPPKGDDQTQILDLANGLGDIAIVNTNIYARMLHSADAQQRATAAKLGLFFPKNSVGKTHINISGIAMTQYSPHILQAVRFMEFLSGAYAQQAYASGNLEYPANTNVPIDQKLNELGNFEEDDLYLEKLGQYNPQAVNIMRAVGWKND